LGARQAITAPGVSADVVNIREGPVSLETVYEEMVAGPGILEQVALAEEEGYDAVVIDCFLDPALRAAREMAAIPVVGAGEAGMLFAMALSERFSIVTVRNGMEAVAALTRAYGFVRRVASIRAVDFPAVALVRNDEAAANAMTDVARAALERDGAELILLGCTGMSGLAALLQRRLDAIVLDPAACALKLAGALVELGLRHSRIAYPDPFAAAGSGRERVQP
jgi:allantoin racemase